MLYLADAIFGEARMGNLPGWLSLLACNYSDRTPVWAAKACECGREVFAHWEIVSCMKKAVFKSAFQQEQNVFFSFLVSGDVWVRLCLMVAPLIAPKT